jgi:hypothetical protein
MDVRAALEAVGRFNWRAGTRSLVEYDLRWIDLAGDDLNGAGQSPVDDLESLAAREGHVHPGMPGDAVLGSFP